MVLSKGVKCFGLLLACSIMLGLSLSVSSDVNAIHTADYGVRTLSWDNGVCDNPVYTENHSYRSWFSACGITTIVPVSSEVTATGNSLIYSGKLNLVKEIEDPGNNAWKPFQHIGVRSIYFGNTELILQQPANVWYWVTRWKSNINNIERTFETLTIQWSFIASANINNTTGRVRMSFYSTDNDTRFDYTGFVDDSSWYYFEPTDIDVQLVFTDSGSSDYSDLINQNQTIINQNQTQINQENQYYSREYDSVDNINNQDSSDIGGATNSQTTSIIGFVGGFVSALGTVQPSNCTLTLPFPQFAGGSKTVNVCSGKEQAPTIVAIGASLLLIGTFIPLAFIVLKMIYNEIRSWTNG